MRAGSIFAGVVVALGLTVAGPALGASAAPAHAAGGILPMKACAEAPEPASPTAGLAGKMAVRPSPAVTGDPFEDKSVAISDVYGYGYQWQDYDDGCLPGVNGVTTDTGNFFLAGAAATNAMTHSMLNYVVDPTWLEPLDKPLTQATAAIKDGFYGPWFTPMALAVAGFLLVFAARANVSGAVTSGGWALLVLVSATYLMSYPTSAAQAVDGLIGETVTASARASGAANVPGSAAKSEARQLSDASTALTAQIDTINRNSLYSSWLEGTLGSSTSKLANKYGPDLFRSSHLTWSEAAVLDNDPQAGKVIVEAKKAAWVDTAAKVEQDDPKAYQQLTGNEGRAAAATNVTIATAVTMPFLLVAGVLVVFAYGATRVFIPLVPAFGVFGMLELARGWVIATVTQFGRILIMGPLFWMGALVNLALVSSVLASDIPYVLKLIIALMMPVILFKLLKPKKSGGMGSSFGRLARTVGGAMLTRRAVGEGVSDASKPSGNDGHTSGYRTADPKAAGPVADPTPPSYRNVGRPVQQVGQRASVGQIGSGVRRNETGADLVPSTRGVAAPRSTPATFVPTSGRGRHAVDPSSRPQLEAAPAPIHEAPRSHPAITPDASEGHGAPAKGREGQQTAPQTPQREDLSAPAQVMRPGEAIPSGIAEANVHFTEDGQSVFTIWRPNGASTTQSTTERESR